MKHLFALAVIALMLTSCAKLRPFTEDLHERAGWTEDDLRRIQFYLSDDIVLSRRLNSGESQITNGKIKIIDGRKVEQVRIAKGTPGVLLFTPKDDRFAISFEEGDDDLFLMFGPNPNIKDRYALLAKEWKRNTGKVSYDGKLWDVDSNSAYAVLMVDVRRIGETEYKGRTAQGRKVD